MNCLDRPVRRLYFDGEFKECLNGHIKPISEFYPHNKKSLYDKNSSCYYRPYCKECLNYINSRRRLEKKRDIFPDKFWDCDNCDHIVSILRTLCNKCGFRRENVL